MRWLRHENTSTPVPTFHAPSQVVEKKELIYGLFLGSAKLASSTMVHASPGPSRRPHKGTPGLAESSGAESRQDKPPEHNSDKPFRVATFLQYLLTGIFSEYVTSHIVKSTFVFNR